MDVVRDPETPAPPDLEAAGPESGAADPVARLKGELEATALGLRERLGDRTLPRALRADVRALLTDVFRAVEAAPATGAKGGRLEWVRDARALLGRGQASEDAILQHLAPPIPFYAGGRLGVIRVFEPVRVRFVIGRLDHRADPARFTMLQRFERRVAWLWDRLRQARPDLFEHEKEKTQDKAYREDNELVWGRVTR